MTARGHFVYRVYDADGKQLYVAATSRPSAHWAELKNSYAAREWAADAARFKVVGPMTKARAFEIRRCALANNEPVHNLTAAKRQARIAHNQIVGQVMRAQIAKGVDVDVAIKAGIAVADYQLGSVA